MADPSAELSRRLAAALATLLPEIPDADPVVRRSDRADYQVNGVLALAKRAGLNPRELADALVARADLSGVCEGVEVAGPGFVNLTLSRDFIEREVTALLADAHGLGVTPAARPDRVVVDYSAPNVAKEMHVGHLRSTVIGDSLCRVLDFLGHTVIRENHIGDWGTPFGMLIEHLVDLGADAGAHDLEIGELGAFYKAARTKFDADEGFKTRSRQRVVALQAGDPETLRLWQILVDRSAEYFQAIYDSLGVLLVPEDLRGESAYNDMLADVVTDLQAAGLLVESGGARCVFPAGFTNREGEPLPVIVQKADGGFGYAATDLATIRDRVGRLGATRILYVVGAPQAEHFALVFAVARSAGWLPPEVEAVHVPFGSVLGPDRKILATRAGTSLRLADLLADAVSAAADVVADKNPDLGPEVRSTVARAVGIGAVKYADLSSDRVKDYVYDLSRMLALDGNTAPYLQYAITRVRSIRRRAAADGLDAGPPDRIVLTEPAERDLALALLGFDAAVNDTAAALAPHRLCTYAFDLAQTFTRFYDACPVLRADDETRRSRLALAELCAAVLTRSLALLGIDALDQM